MLAIPLGWLANALPGWAARPLIAGAGLLYTVPSLALFVLLPPVLGARHPRLRSTSIVALSVYTDRAAGAHGRGRARLVPG